MQSTLEKYQEFKKIRNISMTRMTTSIKMKLNKSDEPNCTRNHYAEFEIDRTTLTRIKKTSLTYR